MKKLSTRLLITALAAGALFSLSSCTTTDSGDGSTNFVGPSTENTSNYTDALRSEFRNNW